MSFILEALKKSEHKRRAQAGEESAAFYALSEKKPVQRRHALQLLLIFLLLGILLFLVVLVWQRPWHRLDRAELPVTVIVEQPVSAPVAHPATGELPPPPAAQGQRPVDVSALVTPAPEEVVHVLQPPVGDQLEPVVADTAPTVVATQLTPAPVKALPLVPISTVAAGAVADRVYSISELPAEVRRRLPALQMALHAYNAADASASLVQINGRLVREGAQLADNLSVDEITSDGAILRSDNYRFLLPRRGQ